MTAAPVERRFTHLERLVERDSELRFMPAAGLASPRPQCSLDTDRQPWNQPESKREDRPEKMPGVSDMMTQEYPLASAERAMCQNPFPFRFSTLHLFYFSTGRIIHNRR